MWEIYDALVDCLPAGGRITRAAQGGIWTAAECGAGGVGTAMTTDGDSFPAMYRDGITGLSTREAALAAKSWNLREASFGVAAANACYNTPERVALLNCAEPWDNYCTRGLDFTGRTVGLVGHLIMPEHTLDGAKRVHILERHPQPGDLPDSACEFVLPECDIVLITGSSLVNKTLPRLLELCRNAFVILTGPTVPLCPALLELGIDRLAGLAIHDGDAAFAHAAESRPGPPYQYGETFLLARDL